MKNVAITGASGFIGVNLFKYLNELGFLVIPFVWKNSSLNFENQIALKIDSKTSWVEHLNGVDCIVHLAALVHSKIKDELHFFEVNTAGTIRLAEQAIQAGVKRFIYISSISVNGAESGNIIFKSTDKANPTTPYAISKHAAEIGLINLKKIYPEFEVIIIRPTMVYGLAAPGNFSMIIRWARLNFPFPRLPRNNARNFLAIQNLVQLISICISHPMAKGRIFLAADPVSYSTYDFVKFACLSSGNKFWEAPIGAFFIKKILFFAGKKNISRSLYASLRVDISDANIILGWNPLDLIGDFICNKKCK